MFQYYKLFDLLRKRQMLQKELIDNGVVSIGTIQRLKRNEYVNTSVLNSICNYLKCDITDILEFVPDESQTKE